MWKRVHGINCTKNMFLSFLFFKLNIFVKRAILTLFRQVMQFPKHMFFLIYRVSIHELSELCRAIERKINNVQTCCSSKIKNNSSKFMNS